MVRHSGVDTWCVTLGTAEAPGHDSYDGVVTGGLPGHQRAPTVALTAVLPWGRGADHGPANVARSVGGGAVCALSVGPRVDVHLLQDTGLAAPGAQCPPAGDGGDDSVVVGAGVGQTGGQHRAGEGDRCGKLHYGEVIVGGPLVIVWMRDPLDGRDYLLSVPYVDIVLPQAHPEVGQVCLAVGGSEDCVGAEESPATERSSAGPAD